MLISVKTDSMNNFINRGFFQIVDRFNVSFFLSIAWEKKQRRCYGNEQNFKTLF